MIDWEQILTQAHIEYQPGAGANIETFCPWCGNIGDPVRALRRLSISLEGNGYRCWRNPDEHYGKSPIRLLMHLLHISAEEAKTLAGYSNSYSVVGGGSTSLVSFVSSALGRNNVSRTNNISPIKTLSFPDGFRTIKELDGTRAVFAYIRSRGYSVAQAEGLIELYDLKTALSGIFGYRVVIPVRMPNIGLVNWTARSITESSVLRYHTLTTDLVRSKTWGMPLAVLQINQTLWNYDRISVDKGRNLVVCEGPFDAIRVDYLGASTNTRGTCVFGKSISDYQISLLEKVRDNYDNLLLVLDSDAEMEGLKKLGRFSHLEPHFIRLPQGVRDPGDEKFKQEEVELWLNAQ